MTPTDRDEHIRTFFDAEWAKGDCWELDSSEFERDKFNRQLTALKGLRFNRALEIGCGTGSFTRQLAPFAESVLALDVSQVAIERAQESSQDFANVSFRVQNIMECDPWEEGPFDLIVLSETIYYLGWKYSFYEVSFLAWAILEAMSIGGRFLMTNSMSRDTHTLSNPWIIYTYHGLFRHVGFELENEETYIGVKHDTEFEVLISVYRKVAEVANVTG